MRYSREDIARYRAEKRRGVEADEAADQADERLEDLERRLSRFEEVAGL